MIIESIWKWKIIPNSQTSEKIIFKKPPNMLNSINPFISKNKIDSEVIQLNYECIQQILKSMNLSSFKVLHNSMILSTLSISFHGFTLDLSKRSSWIYFGFTQKVLC